MSQTKEVSLEEAKSWFAAWYAGTSPAPSNEEITSKISGRELSEEAERWFWETFRAVW